MPNPDTASVANPLEILLEKDSAVFAGSKIIKQKSDWPSQSVLLSKRIYLAVNPKHYPRMIDKLLAGNMVVLRPIGEETIENSIFEV